jgi:peroxiredoxin
VTVRTVKYIFLFLFYIFISSFTPLQNHSKLKVGDIAPEIALLSPNGNVIRLSSLKGHLVLLDFWASWCSPCRRNNPELVDIYEKYHDKNFTSGKGLEIFSISLDTSPGSWEKAIEDDGLSWSLHASDLKKWSSPVVGAYGIKFIPYMVLVDEDGKIVALDLDNSLLKYYLKDNVKK